MWETIDNLDLFSIWIRLSKRIAFTVVCHIPYSLIKTVCKFTMECNNIVIGSIKSAMRYHVFHCLMSLGNSNTTIFDWNKMHAVVTQFYPSNERLKWKMSLIIVAQK